MGCDFGNPSTLFPMPPSNEVDSSLQVVSIFTFMSPVASSMVAPCLPQISAEFNITNSVEAQIIYSAFVLGYAFGPLFLGPLSEEYGRPIVIQLANLFFFIFNTAAGFSRNKEEMIVFRFLSGLGGSAPMSIGGGVVGDVWPKETRGAAMSLYSLGPLLGPAVGPVAGGFVAQYTTWRWTFWATSIVDIFVQVLGLFFLQETYGPKVLQNKVKRLRKDTGNQHLMTEFDKAGTSLAVKLKRSMGRPFILMGSQPIVQVLGLYMAYLYGLIYLVLGSFAPLWAGTYKEKPGIAGLNYISIGLGCFLGGQVAVLSNDRIYKYLKNRFNEDGRPEFRLPLMFPGCILVPAGLLWYGWSAEAKLHWIMVDIGTTIYSMGGIIGFQCIQIYLVDTYARYAASAIAAAAFLRSLFAFAFPLFAPDLYDTLGDGWGNSVLALCALCLGLPSPFLFWKFGAKLRARSPYAAGIE